MPGLFGYFDPDRLLADDTLAIMLRALNGRDDQVHAIEKTTWAGLGIVNYPERSGIARSVSDLRYAVLGDLESLAGRSGSHDVIAEECFGGSNAPENLLEIRGGFVAAILDSTSHAVTLVSDRFASYPLYVMQYKSAWIFSSQIKAILAVLPERPRLDQVSVSTMLSIGEVVGDRTLIDGIRTLSAATVMRISSSGVEFEKYWQYVYEENPGSNWQDSVDRIGMALGHAVQSSLGHSQSPAVPLSGGLDSRFILDLASHGQLSLAAYTWGISGCRDIRYAQDVARRLQCKHETFIFQDDYLSSLGELGVWLTEGHIPATNFHVLPYVNELASRGHDVILDGFAGDGLLGGNFISNAWLDNPDLGAASELLWQWRRRGFDGTWEPSALNDIHACAGEEFKKLYQGYPGNTSMDKAMAFLIDNRVRRITTCGTELFRSRILVKQPFMDAEVIEVMRTLPHRWRKRHRFYLSVLQKHAPISAQSPYQRTMLPANVPYWASWMSLAAQRGYGFLAGNLGLPDLLKGKSPSDFPAWFRGPLRLYVENLLLDERTLDRGIVSAEVIQTVLNLHMEQKRDMSSLIGALITLEVFARRFIDDLSGSVERLSSWQADVSGVE